VPRIRIPENSMQQNTGRQRTLLLFLAARCSFLSASRFFFLASVFLFAASLRSASPACVLRQRPSLLALELRHACATKDPNLMYQILEVCPQKREAVCFDESSRTREVCEKFARSGGRVRCRRFVGAFGGERRAGVGSGDGIRDAGIRDAGIRLRVVGGICQKCARSISRMYKSRKHAPSKRSR
jgi:hypothetical protein